MRFAQYLVLITFGIGGLFLGDELGPLTGIVNDWHLGMDPEYSRAVSRYHGIMVGACAALPMLIVGRLFQIKEVSAFGISLILGTVFYLLPFAKHGELSNIYAYLSLPYSLAPYIVGLFASFGAMFLFGKMLSLLRAVRQF